MLSNKLLRHATSMVHFSRAILREVEKYKPIFRLYGVAILMEGEFSRAILINI